MTRLKAFRIFCFLFVGIWVIVFGMDSVVAQTQSAFDQDPAPLNVDEFKSAIHLPEYYPYDGMNLKLFCHILIDENGIPIEWVFLGRCDFLIAYQANGHVNKLRFQQARIKGQPVKAWVMLPVYFTVPELVDSVVKPRIKPGENPKVITTIYYIDRSKTNLDSIPEEYLRFSNLQVLYLNGNDISYLPDSICKLSELRILGLQGNKFTTLPSCISELKKLEYLFLGDNFLNTDKVALQKQLPNTKIIWDRAFENPEN